MIAIIQKLKLRNCYLAITAIGINLTVVYTAIVPEAGNRSIANFQFPSNLKLNSVVAVASKNSTKPISSPPETNQETIRAWQQYQYRQQNHHINLSLGYLVNTRGDVAQYLQRYTSISPESIKNKQVKKIEGIGYHTFFNEENIAYLSSCISPRSLSNITQRQFSQYRYQNDLKLSLAWGWLRGKSSIRDRRCIWVYLSTPILKSDSQAAYQALETTWRDLYHWWLLNFPAL